MDETIKQNITKNSQDPSSPNERTNPDRQAVHWNCYII